MDIGDRVVGARVVGARVVGVREGTPVVGAVGELEGAITVGSGVGLTVGFKVNIAVGSSTHVFFRQMHAESLIH